MCTGWACCGQWASPRVLSKLMDKKKSIDAIQHGNVGVSLWSGQSESVSNGSGRGDAQL